jgi:hypothetical protein
MIDAVQLSQRDQLLICNCSRMHHSHNPVSPLPHVCLCMHQYNNPPPPPGYLRTHHSDTFLAPPLPPPDHEQVGDDRPCGVDAE